MRPRPIPLMPVINLKLDQGPAGNQLSGAFLVNVNYADQPLEWIGVDVDALSNGGAGAGDERDRDGGQDMRASHRATMPAIQAEP
jgi:hypothetical protein